MPAPPETVRLYGEMREARQVQRIEAGPFSAVIEDLGLRWLCWRGTEILRGISFVVRDRDWGTYVPDVLRVEHDADASHCRLWIAARVAGALDCALDVAFSPGGALRVSVLATALADFQTNRTGFVILHPAACAGARARVEHVDGTASEGAFPSRISPHQPFLGVRAIGHEPAPGLWVRCEMQGDTFETEDQRNWSDASFKTYCRPLSAPFPYRITAGETVVQSVLVQVEKTATALAAPAPNNGREAVRVVVSSALAGVMPRLALGGKPADFAASAVQCDLLARLRPDLLVAEFDPATDETALAPLRPCLDATDAGAAFLVRLPRDGAEAMLRRLQGATVVPQAVALSGATPDALAEARRRFPGAQIGAGTAAFFAEFNRTPPPAGADLVFWTVSPTVHATDDASVMETLSVLTDQAHTARALCPGARLWCGPVTLRMRFNPNATRPAPGLGAGAAAPADPRQRGLLAAVFTLGQIAAWTSAGLDTLVLYEPFGPRGLIHARADRAQPWYDALPGPAVYPAYQVLAGLAGQGGRAIRTVLVSAPSRVAALATEEALWLANLSATPTLVAVEGVAERASVRWLDAESFVEATTRPDGFWMRDMAPLRAGRIMLGSYAVARIAGP